MNITILKNKNHLINDYIINKYKFIYIENEFSEEILNLIYNYFGLAWYYTDIKLFTKKIKYLYKDKEDFKNSFEIIEFNSNLEAENFLKNERIDSIEDKNILEINKYQIFWYLTFIKQRNIHFYKMNK